ncbi:transcription repressor NadR [Cellulosilyticum lentocellum]|uniref:3H domain-containing protein n=1 Tax=Cellulosilyticum lentocellum (strain ATCC 49066 / DSM 5427 / NCIMB 11756 / RHM5) TaxID=642492 RepID=F2JRX9_CELLD|nr:transcription repressor NadR [Cellulosilyticum lentocellum]ADZ82793.1 3H domain-containing protein [Cellulosilyticum lentocellum DSM 5427]
MDGEQRREEILKLLERETKPISGTYLSKHFKVSRQVIVQDVALLRASGYDILATARGYILNQDASNMLQRVIWVKHTHDEAEDELNTIIDNGGRVRNVIIMHPVYGEVVADLMIKTRREIKQFVEKLKETKASTLLSLTDGMHMHTIEASSKEELDIIEEELNTKGYLVTHS